MHLPRRSHTKRGRALPAAFAIGALVATGLATAPTAQAAVDWVQNPASYVNTLAGTGSGGPVVGTINNFPGPAAPYGMIQFSPSNGNNGTGYRWDNQNLQGFAVNMASQGCTAFGNFPMLPTTINPTTGTPWTRINTLQRNTQVAEPGYYAVTSTDADTRTIVSKLTATDRAGIAEFEFPAGQTPAITLRAGRMNNKDSSVSSFNVNPLNQTVTGWAVSKGFCSATPHSQYKIYFTAKFDQPFTHYGAWNEDQANVAINKTVANNEGDAEIGGVRKAGGYVRFATGTTTVRAKIAISYVQTGDLALGQADPSSHHYGGSSLNLATEIPTPDYKPNGVGGYANYAAAFAAVRQETFDRWNALLGKVKISDTATDRDIKTFYHSLYRTFLHPNVFNDVDGKYAGFETFNFTAAEPDYPAQDPVIHTVAAANAEYNLNIDNVYSNFSDWDTYRSWAPLAAALTPKEMSDMNQTYVLQADQSGSFPRWSIANASTGQMSGDNATAQIAQGYAFGATEFSVGKALHWMYEGALGATAGEYTGGQNRKSIQRPGAKEYNLLGFAPQTPALQTDHAVTGASIAQEWSIDDLAVSEFARAIGTANYPTGGEAVPANVDQLFRERANNWLNHMNPLTGCLSPRDSQGRFPVGSDCNVTPNDFGHRGAVTGYGQVGFDEAVSEQYLWMVPQNLAGLATVLGGRDATADRLDTFMTGGYNVGANVPKMWAGNEPNFSTPWAYNYLGRPWRTSEVVDDIRNQLFGYLPDGAEPGNDDLGAMSAWYVWAALGIYPATPGTTIMTVNTPNFEHAQVSLGNGKTLTINAPDATSKRYIAGLSVNGVPQSSTALPDGWLDNDTTLDFALANGATTWGTGVADAPASFFDGFGDVIAYADPVRFAPGGSATTTFAVQRAGSTATRYSIDSTTVPAGFSVTSTASAQFDSAGHSTQDITVRVGPQVGEGDYVLPVTVVTSAGERHSVDLHARVAAPGTFFAATNVQSHSADSIRDVDFEKGGSGRDGNGFIRDLLSDKGLTPGSSVDIGTVSGQSALNGLKAKLIASSEGTPDSIIPNGQTVTLTGNPTKISLVGSARGGNVTATATVTLDNGDTVTTVTASMGDWVLPESGSGSTWEGRRDTGQLNPMSGNYKVAWTPVRIGQSNNPGAYVYATTPYTAPAGRTIASVTLTGSSNDNRRIFAIAQDTESVVPPVSVPTQTLSASSVQAGGSVTVSGSGFVAGESVTAFLDEASVATGTANGSGAVVLTVTVPKLSAAGAYRVRLSGATSGGTTANNLTVTAATWTPSITAPAQVLVGNQVVITGTGFAESEPITVTLGTQSIDVIASASGGLTASLPGATTPSTLTITASGTLSGAVATRSVEFVAAPPGGGDGGSTPATLGLSVAPAIIGYGGSVTARVQTAASVAGQVEFFAGSRALGKVTLSGGVASLRVPGLAAGSHALSAKLVGTSATSPTVYVSVVKAAAGAVKVSGKKYKRKKATTLTVKVGNLTSGQRATGKVRVYVGKKVAKTVTLKAANKGTIKVKIAKKFTTKKTIKVKAVFTPADTKNVIGGTSTVKTIKARR